MWIEYAAYVVTFVVSSGLSAMGIMLSYQLYQTHQKPHLQILLYQQIFLISFFLFAIWGNMILHEIIADLKLNPTMNTRLSVFIPLLGLPFLMVSWFMLLRFSFVLNGINTTRRFAIGYFASSVLIVFAVALFVQFEKFPVIQNADLFIVRTLLVANLGIHLIFIAPFWIKKKQLNMECDFSKNSVYLYFGATIIYTAAWSFFNVFGFISVCIAIVLLFAGNILIPVLIKLNSKEPINKDNAALKVDFEEFCNQYEISKREAEIILEICSGKTNKAIAEKLFITLQTVKDHNCRIYSKTQVKSRVQLSNLVRERTENRHIKTQ